LIARLGCIGFLLGWLAFATVADAAVRIVDDEVIFTIDAPGAKNVFLVGDFNNWNPTLEKMDGSDGAFEVYLFLLPGSYRYKFVVDGEWVVDPDNPPADPAKGSVLVLEERGGMLAFGSTEKVEPDAGPVLEPHVRYVGVFRLDDGSTDSDQRFDFLVGHSSKRIDAMVDFRTVSDSWSVDPLEARVDFDRGFVDLHFGEKTLRAFENDTTWTSADPFHLFGHVGVFDYNAGYERHGAAAVFPLPVNLEFRALYTDKIGERPQGPFTLDLPGASSADTTAYGYQNSFSGMDTWGIEFFADAGSFKLGYVKRGNRGFQQGTLAVVEDGDDGREASVYTTREFWDADAAWLRWRFLGKLAVVAGLGRASADVRTDAMSTYSLMDSDGVSVGQVAEPSDRKIPIQESKRWLGALEYEKARWSARARYSSNAYDFEAPLNVPAEATIQTAELEGEYRSGAWKAEAGLRYLDQDYGAAPEDFHFFTPSRNFWLDYRDKLTIDNMVVFDTPRSTRLSASFWWNQRTLSRLSRIPSAASTAVHATGALVMREIVGSVEYAELRAAVDRRIYRYIFGQLDARAAFYDKPSWDLSKTYVSLYAEAAYRRNWIEASLGFGFDPVVLDPVINEYSDIGRLRHVRGAIPEGIERSDAAALGDGVRLQEESLRDNRVLKLEVIVFF
jgi:hypothetical protein